MLFARSPKTVVILRSALWDPFAEAEWACAEPALSEAEGKDLLLPLPLFLLVIPTERSRACHERSEWEGSLRVPQISNQKAPHPDRSSANALPSGGTRVPPSTPKRLSS